MEASLEAVDTESSVQSPEPCIGLSLSRVVDSASVYRRWAAKPNRWRKLSNAAGQWRWAATCCCGARRACERIPASDCRGRSTVGRGRDWV